MFPRTLFSWFQRTSSIFLKAFNERTCSDCLACPDALPSRGIKTLMTQFLTTWTPDLGCTWTCRTLPCLELTTGFLSFSRSAIEIQSLLRIGIHLVSVLKAPECSFVALHEQGLFSGIESKVSLHRICGYQRYFRKSLILVFALWLSTMFATWSRSTLVRGIPYRIEQNK